VKSDLYGFKVSKIVWSASAFLFLLK